MELYDKIRKLAFELGFADVGCARAQALSHLETSHYREALSSGFFGRMEYLARNTDKRDNPTLLLPGAKSVLVFLVPFSFFGDTLNASDDSPRAAPLASSTLVKKEKLKVSEFALGSDYHTVIKERLNRIANLIDRFPMEMEDSRSFKKYKSLTCRVFTDSAPIMERAWAVRAGLGFIGKNNFLISRKCGVKNFIGVILTTVELPYYELFTNTALTRCETVNSLAEDSSAEKSEDKFYDVCGKCTRCLEACTQKALFAPRRIDARKCLSYKTIEMPITEENPSAEKINEELSKKSTEEANSNVENKWIFGCDDCMNACPWNRLNLRGWEEFHTNAALLRSVVGSTKPAPGETPEWWENLTHDEFDNYFKNSPLQRAGLTKIVHNLKRYE